ncbi:hypothetical protein COCSUDRAFT_34569 [Coccomyxa subellipsoidea C-169]|uniref:Uncharacterized protein n=1 Tax=Coccomyxa subellipsoidea (strain C-169) TaxID=574566 RepID=I0YJ59_COCSC|nr:hypothetical protein COCSUDRAFT_34569 [Coccomyxa subellipsoidea C-169]EIE18428.1 hypothetical protein COCSUDRAFT_34569 [Coccomyxa subellipsoidea C-169]|eukprot:XP_005642972.1 hypothetical protein COCSUDRAFT_34569 [Coccomyxa subellipsoidea C-169]
MQRPSSEPTQVHRLLAADCDPAAGSSDELAAGEKLIILFSWVQDPLGESIPRGPLIEQNFSLSNGESQQISSTTLDLETTPA